MLKKITMFSSAILLALVFVPTFAISPGAGNAQIQNNMQQMQQNKQQIEQRRQNNNMYQQRNMQQQDEDQEYWN